MPELRTELNRLAGTTNLDAQGAANTYAGTTGMDLVGALNVKAGIALASRLELNGVASRLAGTTDTEAASALALVPAIVRVQRASNATATASATATFSATPTSGNRLIAVGRSSNGHAIHALTGWTKINGQDRGLGGGVSVWHKQAGASEPAAVTFDGGVAATSTDLAVFEFSGLAAAPTDQFVGTDGGAGAITSLALSPATTTQAAELLIAAVAGGSLGAGVSWSNSFVEETSTTRLHVATRIVATTGSYGTTHVWTSSVTAAGIVATFKAA